MSKELEEYFKLEEKILCGKAPNNCTIEEWSRYKELEDILRNQQPTKEELRKSIIERLNEYYNINNVEYEGKSFGYYRECKPSAQWSGIKSVAYLLNGKLIMEDLPLQLAHDITRYFLMEEEG